MNLRTITSLDLKLLIPELEILKGGRIQKTFQEGKTLRIEIYIPTKGTKELLFSPGKLFLTNYKRKAGEPGGFAMFLRKYLMGQTVQSVKQPGFERILDIETEHYILHLELFSKGNAILCDKAGIIVHPMEKQEWKDRKILPGEKYLYPPPLLDPFSMTEEDFEKTFSESNKKLVILLAVRFGLSGIYAEEICLRAEFQKDMLAKEINIVDIPKIREAIISLTKNISPNIIPGIGPFPVKLKTHEDKKSKEFPSFLDALDEYYTQDETRAISSPVTDEKNRLERILEQQKIAVEKWTRIEKESREKAELIQKNYQTVEQILIGLEKAKKLGLEWNEIKQRISQDPNISEIIKEIREDDGKIVLNLK